MKIETTAMDDVWIGVMTVAVLYLVMRTIATLERISKKVDKMVDHIGNEVESAISSLSKEANGIIRNLEKNASVYKDHISQHVQGMELQCYRTKNGIFAMGLGPRTSKKKLQTSNHSSVISAPPPSLDHASTVATNQAGKSPAEAESGSSNLKKKGHLQGQQLVAIHKFMEKVLKSKYKLPFHHKRKSSKQCSQTTTCSTVQHAPVIVSN